MALTSGDIIKMVVTMVWGDAGVNMNVFNLLLSGAGGPWDELDILSDLEDWATAMYGHLNNVVSESLEGTDVDGYVWDTGELDWDSIGNEPWGWSPIDTGHTLPRGVAGLVIAPTVDPDTQAKKYMGGLTENSNVDGTWNAACLTALGNFANAWVTSHVGAASGATLAPGCWSPTYSELYSFKDAYNLGSIAAYQRRRKRGVGI